MFYRVNIQKFEDNPNYQEELKAFREQEKRDHWDRRDSNMQHPEPEIAKEMLSVVLNDEQFEAMKKAVLEKF